MPASDDRDSSQRDPANDPPEIKQARDDARCQAAVQSVKDVLWRFDETSEGNYTLYDVFSYIVEDLVADGCCAACLGEAMAAAFEQSGVNPLEHKPDEDIAVLH